MTTSLRTIKTLAEYDKFRIEGGLENGCRLCEIKEDQNEIVKEFKYWVIAKNKFPWDLISKVNHLLIPKRHALYKELNKEEKDEFDFIKSSCIENEYELLAEVVPSGMSIPEHYHAHLIILKGIIGE